MTFGELLLSLLVIFFMVVFFMILFSILMDLFRSHDLSGWAKAGWVLLIVVLPFLGMFIYLIARGQGMTERSMKKAEDQQKQFDRYVQNVAGSGSGGAAQEIAHAKELLDGGAISQEEFDSIKRKALA